VGTLAPVSQGVHIGVDIGQQRDPTAVCVVELELRGYTRDEEDGYPRGGQQHYVGRHIERMPLGTPYPAVVSRLVAINAELRKREQEPRFWLDATGVGQPVVDLLDQAGLCVTPVYLTGSEKATWDGRDLRLGKAPLVSRLQVLLQSGRIHLPQTAEAQALVQELLNYEIKVSEDAHAQFGAFKTGTHDDLATALGLACWQEATWLLF
jgi:hypothetical protein